MLKKRDVEEYEVGTQKQAAGVSAASVQSTADVLNPYEFSLIRVNLQLIPSQPLGFDVKADANGALKVTSVDGQEAVARGIEKEFYLVSMDGQRIKSEAEFKKKIENMSKKRAIHISLAKKRPSPLESSSFPLPASVQRQPGRQYFLFRLDPTDGKRVGTGIGEKNGIVSVTQILNNSAGSKAGIRVGDRVLAIDGTQVENRERCRTLVHETMGNPFDMIIERGPLIPAQTSQAKVPAPSKKTVPVSAPCLPPTPPPPPAAPAPATTPDSSAVSAQTAPPPDPNAGDPSAGVPSTPTDVSVFLESNAKKALNYIRMTPKKEKDKATPKQSDSVFVPPKKATWNKEVDKTKLQKQ